MSKTKIDHALIAPHLANDLPILIRMSYPGPSSDQGT